MDIFVGATIFGLVTGAIYAIAASGLVVTYTTSGIFNFAHGAVGMFMAFLYWQTRVDWNWPAPIAFVFVVFIAAPLMGAGIERGLMRGLSGSSVTVSLVVTIGLTLLLIGAAQDFIWKTEARAIEDFFGPTAQFGFIAGVNVSAHQIITFVFAGVVALVLRFLLFQTRTGVAMRAVVDDRNLLALNGGKPSQMGLLSWGIGSSLAALAGILIAPTLQLQHIILTFLVVNAYAAAMVGRLKSLPLTFAGAIALGLGQSYLVNYQQQSWVPSFIRDLTGLNAALPTVFLFAVLLVTPEVRLRVGRVAGAKAPRVPTVQEASIAGAALVVVVAALAAVLTDDLVKLGIGLSLGMIMLSLVVLVGYGGQISLAQFTFAGIGFIAFAQVGGGGTILSLVAAVVITSLVGALIALPALRLQGLYLALATLAFAKLVDEMIVTRPWFFGGSGSREIPRLTLGPLGLEGDKALVIAAGVTFAAMAVMVIAIRRSTFGRLLFAMNDSPAACQTLGLDLTRTKLTVFALSAGMAGLGGVFYGQVTNVVSTADVNFIQSLPILLMAVVGGITTVSGALIGGVLYALLLRQEPIETAYLTVDVQQAAFMLVGIVAVSLGRNPNGLAFLFYDRFGGVFRKLFARIPGFDLPAIDDDVEESADAPPALAPVAAGGS